MKTETMRILTVRQPWASLIVLGYKPIENRHWATDYRGDVAILAGKGVDVGDRARQAYDEYLRAHFSNGLPPSEAIRKLPAGGVIGVAELYDITRTSKSWWFTGPVGLCLRNPRQLKNKEGKPCMVEMPGNLSLFKALARDEAIIRQHLA